MNVKITKAEKGSNTGSSANLALYLEKENKGKQIGEKKYFFSHSRDKVSVQEVIRNLDGNKKNLGKNDAKFYLINISPSKEELKHIGNDEKKLQAYTRKVMDAYARNFGKGLEGKDLMYYGKIEHERKYHGNDDDVKAGLVNQGDKKPGFQTHIHVIVSRKDIENKLKLSPLSKHRATTRGAVKGGFDWKNFYTQAEKIWDKEMKYERPLSERFEYQLAQKQGDIAKVAELEKADRLQRSIPLEKEPAIPRALGAKAPSAVKSIASAIKKGSGYELVYDEDLAGKKKDKGRGLGLGI